MSRARSMALILLVVLLGTATTQARDKPARFSGENPKQVEEVTVEVKFEVDEELISTSDVWVAVLPMLAPSSIYLQGIKVSTSPDERVVYLGQEGVVLPRPEKYKVILLSVPRGTFTRDGEVRIADATELGVRFIDQITILRTR